MSSENPTIQLAIERVSESLRKFRERTEQIEQILRARHALATVEYIDDYTKQSEYRSTFKDLPQEQLVKSVSKYSDSLPGLAPKYHVLNEAGVVLLSAYLEGFIEELHKMVMQELTGESIKSTRVLRILETLSQDACKRFQNPKPAKIKKLFRVCGIEDAQLSDRSLKWEKVGDFVELRNKIAHGEQVIVEGSSAEQWLKVIFRFGEQLSTIVRNEIITVKSEQQVR